MNLIPITIPSQDKVVSNNLVEVKLPDSIFKNSILRQFFKKHAMYDGYFSKAIERARYKHSRTYHPEILNDCSKIMAFVDKENTLLKKAVITAMQRYKAVMRRKTKQRNK